MDKVGLVREEEGEVVALLGMGLAPRADTVRFDGAEIQGLIGPAVCLGTTADGLDLEAVKVEGEGPVERLRVLGALARRAGIPPAGGERLAMEGVHGGAARRVEADVEPEAGPRAAFAAGGA